MCLALVLLIGAAASVAAHVPSAESRGTVTAARPGQVVARGALSAVAPAKGEAVWGEIHFEDGAFEVLELETDRAGVVTARHGRFAPVPSNRGRTDADSQGASALEATESAAPSATPAPTATATATPRPTTAECTNGEYYLYGWRMPTYGWAFQSGSTPSYLASRTNGTALVLDSMKRANTNIVTGRNVCGRTDAISATYSYLGWTSRAPNISSSASCTGGNGYSTVGFGSLPYGVAAMACAYRIVSGVAKEGDIRLSTGVRWATSSATCSDAYLVESVMTHEFGHVYGLRHVASSALTMYRSIRKCSMAAATLGLGDLRGLERKY